MKRFDKGYVYFSAVIDFFGCFILTFAIASNLLFDENADPQKGKLAMPYVIAAVCLLYVCLVIYRIIYYKTSYYEMTDTEIKCGRGVLFRKKSVLDYKRIHAINKKQDLLHRIFGIAILTIDSGSANTSHQAEMLIIEKAVVVDSLIRELNELKQGGARESVETAKSEELFSDKDILYKYTSKKKMGYTLINIIYTALITAIIGILVITVIGVLKSELQLNELGTWGQYFTVALLITIAVVLILTALSFIGSIIYSFVGYHNFVIEKCRNDIQISFGLLERHTNTFSYDRIKAVKIQQNLMQRIFGFATIRLEVIGYTSETENNNVEIGVLIPFCKYEEAGIILSKVLPDYIPAEKQTKSVAFFPFVSWFMLIFISVTGIILSLTIAVLSILNVTSIAIIAVLLAALSLAFVVCAIKIISAILAYKTNGIAVSEDKITTYSGGFTKNVTIFKSKNLVAVESVTTPLRQKAGITSFVLHLKTNETSNEVKVHIQNDANTAKIEKMLVL